MPKKEGTGTPHRMVGAEPETGDGNVTPEWIRDREFSTVVWGFDMAAVGAFVEDVAEAHTAVVGRGRVLDAAVDELAAARLELPDDAHSALEEMRQRAADELRQAAVAVAEWRADAERERARLLAAARDDAAALTEQVVAEAESARDEALMATRREVARFEEETAEFEQRRDVLARTVNEVRDELRDLAERMASVAMIHGDDEEEFDVA
jgi:DivIVA domain-containing protein